MIIPKNTSMEPSFELDLCLLAAFVVLWGTYLKTDREIGAEHDKSLTHDYRDVSASRWGHVSPGC
jgi:hypothetical protein